MFTEIKQRLKGSIAPVITPFDQDDKLDLVKMSELINWQIESGSHGISVTGTSGEPNK